MFLHALLPPPPVLCCWRRRLLLIWGKRRRLGATLVAVALACLWLCSVPVVSNALWRLAERYPASRSESTTHAQAIVILGGGGIGMRLRNMAALRQSLRCWTD